jgi:predicted SnoaL-like aldol condensation-catalyzing enzyme
MSTLDQQVISEQNRGLVWRWFEEVWNQGRRETIQELFAPECVLHDGSKDYRGPEEFTRFHEALRSEFSDFHVAPIISLCEGNLACMHWSVDCKHTASGKPVHLTGMSVVRIKDGQFMEAWQNWDAAGVEKQIRAQAAAAAG